MVAFTYESPYGPIEVESTGGRLSSVTLGGSAASAQPDSPPPALKPCVEYLDSYFAGRPSGDVRAQVDLSERTEFERKILDALVDVPFGSLVSYGELAERAGCPRAARAAGGAVGSNPAPIFIPCHRVIRSSGALGGFGAGTEWKTALLRHEGWAVVDGRVEKKRTVAN